jgi:TonB family protein
MTMENILHYLLILNLLLVVQVLYYRLFLARQSRLTANRIYLMGGIALALILPLIQIKVMPPSLPNPAGWWVLPEVLIGGNAGASPAWGLGDAAFAAYAGVAAVLILRLLGQNVNVLRQIRNGKQERREGYTLVRHAGDWGPATYFRFVFWNDQLDADAEGGAVALAHELCHSRQGHSFDLLVVEILKAICWFNPAVYLMAQDLRQTHEFLADRAALPIAGEDGIKRLLLATHYEGQSLKVVHPFHSHIKARMLMLKQNLNVRSRLRYFLVLPMACLLFACTSLDHKLEAQAPASNEVKPPPPVEGRPISEVTDPNAVVEIEVMPEVLNMAAVVKAIGYPAVAKSQMIEGKVIVRVLVDEKGDVSEYTFLKENHVSLRDAVAAHVNELKFKPASNQGKALKAWVTIPFQFKLK